MIWTHLPRDPSDLTQLHASLFALQYTNWPQNREHTKGKWMPKLEELFYWNTASGWLGDPSHSSYAMMAVDWRAQSYRVEISTKSTLSHVTKLLTPHPLNAAHNPAIMKRCVRSFIVSQINTLTRVAHDIAYSWIGPRTIPHQFLQICDIGWGNCARLSAACPKFQRSDIPRLG
jgi:hypothetical protein